MSDSTQPLPVSYMNTPLDVAALKALSTAARVSELFGDGDGDAGGLTGSDGTGMGDSAGVGTGVGTTAGGFDGLAGHVGCSHEHPSKACTDPSLH